MLNKIDRWMDYNLRIALSCASDGKPSRTDTLLKKKHFWTSSSFNHETIFVEEIPWRAKHEFKLKRNLVKKMPLSFIAKWTLFMAEINRQRRDHQVDVCMCILLNMHVYIYICGCIDNFFNIFYKCWWVSPTTSTHLAFALEWTSLSEPPASLPSSFRSSWWPCVRTSPAGSGICLKKYKPIFAKILLINKWGPEAPSQIMRVRL